MERRLFGWLAALAALPALLVLATALVVGTRSLRLVGTLGPWEEVGRSGRLLIEAAGRVDADTALAAAAEAHRQDLSNSLVQANRWRFLEQRLAATAPGLIAAMMLVLIIVALLVSRRLARQMASPIGELVDWAGRLGRGESLPAEAAHSRAREPIEIVTLRDSLRSAADEISAARKRELEAERTRAWGEMARRVAHEMKNPLTPLRLAAHRIAGRAGGDPAMIDAAEVIREETDRLDELARGFAALGRPAPGPPTEVDLAELLETLLETDVPGQIGTSMSATAGTTSVIGQYDDLRRAFRNIVGNAVEAMNGHAAGGEGTIEVRITGDDAAVEVIVADNGPGIPADLTEAIFEPDRTLKARGTGLGLAIVRQVTAAHGGTVDARNRSRGGAEFVVRLPRKSQGARAPQPRGQA